MVLKKESNVESININKKDVAISYYKDSGAGGQHRNKVLSGVRLQYKGIKVECCETRDQRKNKELAFQRLEEKIKESMMKERLIKNKNQLSSQNPNCGKRGNFKRNYNYMRDEVVQDGKKYKLSQFMRGNLEKLYGKI